MWQALLALGVAVIGFLGVVVGAVVTGFVTLRQTQLATQREREAQQMLREQQRRDARDAFQRDAILALQGAVEDYWQLVEDWFNQVTGATTAKGSEPPARPPYELTLRRNTVYGRLTATRARVFDDELRKLAEQVQHRGIMVTVGKSRDLKEWAWSRGDESLSQLHERVNTLLRDLF
jgi:type II secretory pathway pseudopilin PulG